MCIIRIIIIIFSPLMLILPAFCEEVSSTGTGFVVNDDGWLLTNAHVVENCSRIQVANLGNVIDVRKDTTNDLALIKVLTDLKVKPLHFRLGAVRLGEDIIALGYPLSGVLSDTIKMTSGNINSLSGMNNDTRFLQVSTPIQPGNSGGPIVDKQGNVIGITTSTLSKRFSDEIGYSTQNVNFAIRIAVADLFMQSQGMEVAYTQQIDKHDGEISTADITEAVAPSIFNVICYVDAKPTTTPLMTQASQNDASANSPPQGQAFGMLHQNNYDAIGFDYDIIRNIGYDQCSDICEQEQRCMAITYHKRFHSCMLKTDVVALIKNKDAAASYRAYKAKGIIFSDFTAYSGYDFPGGDYARIKNTDYLGCFVSCIDDNQCKAFSFLPKKKECWLKDRLGQPRIMKNVELGIK